MKIIKDLILGHVRLRGCHKSSSSWVFVTNHRKSVLGKMQNLMFGSVAGSSDNDQIMDRVIGLVKKFDKIDSSKVTERADFQKDLCLDSLDRVELVMAFEEEFSIEIPDEKADKLTCCADVANYIVSHAQQKTVDS